MKYVEPPHPRQEPRFAGELTGEHIRFLFRDCVDFGEREVLIGGDPEKRTRVFFIQGQVRGERLNDYVLRPLATSLALRAASPKSAARLMRRCRAAAAGVVLKPLGGNCAVLPEKTITKRRQQGRFHLKHK